MAWRGKATQRSATQQTPLGFGLGVLFSSAGYLAVNCRRSMIENMG